MSTTTQPTAAQRAVEQIRALFNGDLSHGRSIEAIIDNALAAERAKAEALASALEDIECADYSGWNKDYWGYTITRPKLTREEMIKRARAALAAWREETK